MRRILRAIGPLAICFTLYPCVTVSAQVRIPSERHDRVLPPPLEVPQPPQQIENPTYSKLVLPFEVPQPPQNATAAAKEGKQSFRQITLNDKIARELGFDFMTDAADSNTILGDPFALVLVNFAMLKNYDSTVPPETLLAFSKRFIYPLAVSNKTKSSITVLELTSPHKIPQEQEWKPVVWGEQGLIRLLDDARAVVGSPSTSFAVWIPQLGRYFLGDIRGRKFTITPLYNEPTLGFTAGTSKPATDVFILLSPEARTLPVARLRSQPPGMSP